MAMATTTASSKTDAAVRFTEQAEKLSLLPHDSKDDRNRATTAVRARFITPQDPVIETAGGGRLPAIPLAEAQKLNKLKSEAEGREFDMGPTVSDQSDDNQQTNVEDPMGLSSKEALEGIDLNHTSSVQSAEPEVTLRSAVPPSRTNPLFPPLPLYGPPTFMRNVHCNFFRFTSFFLSLSFLGVIVLGSAFTSIPLMFKHIGLRLAGKDPDARRPFYEEEKRRKRIRNEVAEAWKHQRRRANSIEKSGNEDEAESTHRNEEYVPTEGGDDPLICDVGYYARAVGLDIEEFRVQTEDGFIIQLWHVYDPREYRPAPDEIRNPRDPVVFPAEQAEKGRTTGAVGSQYSTGTRRYPVLLVHGLLQSSGAYCCNDEDSLAFFLCKSGYDVWLGNNRCGFDPKHTMLEYSDPRMWAWNIRQMGVLDLPALISRVLSETGFEKLGLVCHSQGTTQTFVALAKEQRPDLGNKISVFCALAPAAYAGPLVDKMYLKFMRVISPYMFRLFFGVHAFIPFMMTMHSLLPGKLYGALGYRVFSFLFNWTDDRWDQGLRDRMFQFAPVYVSAESMRWWLGRECFAMQRCILATREEGRMEDEEDEDDVYYDENGNPRSSTPELAKHVKEKRGRTAWYDEQVPPMAFWIAGSDALVDGRRLLRRFERGHEPHARIVHSRIIPEYEHLDVIWAMDSIDKVGSEVRDVIWNTAAPAAKAVCRIPKGCAA
ncbi:hypothetical protein MMC19_003083 [Ptychographa xylographoides]|nr:hypothetical protein [Ptychographa xylographoides]